MILHKNKEDFQALINVTADYFQIPQVYIEKDYWVTYILEKLSNSVFKNFVVFKGGTSLSKAFQLIDRFSEDIDLQVTKFDGGDSKKKTLFKNIERTITEGLTHLKNDIRNKKSGNIRKTVYSYELQNKDHEFYQASKEIILEVNTMSTPEPYQIQKLNSYIAEYLEKKDDTDSISEFELEPFELNVLNKTRTFVEKIFAVLDFTFEEDPIAALSNGIRHIYDIRKLYDDEEINRFFNSEAFNNLCNKVVVENDFFGKRKERRYSETILIDINTLEKIKNTYNKEFSKLVFVGLPEFEKIKEALSIIITKVLVWEQNYRN